jgi:hypothetical protein
MNTVLRPRVGRWPVRGATTEVTRHRRTPNAAGPSGYGGRPAIRSGTPQPARRHHRHASCTAQLRFPQRREHRSCRGDRRSEQRRRKRGHGRAGRNRRILPGVAESAWTKATRQVSRSVTSSAAMTSPGLRSVSWTCHPAGSTGVTALTIRPVAPVSTTRRRECLTPRTGTRAGRPSAARHRPRDAAVAACLAVAQPRSRRCVSFFHESVSFGQLPEPLLPTDLHHACVGLGEAPARLGLVRPPYAAITPWPTRRSQKRRLSMRQPCR